MGEEEAEEEKTSSKSQQNVKETSESESELESEECKTNSNNKKESVIKEVSERLKKGDLITQIQAAKDIRKFIRKSVSHSKTRSLFASFGVIQPLIFMLFSSNFDARHSSLLALLNLAVRNERNKIDIVTAGAIPPLVELLKLQNGNLRELGTAAILTLSAAEANKQIIVDSGAGPLLVQILNSGNVQEKVDAVTTLHNLSTCTKNSNPIADSKAVSPLIRLLKDCKKYSKFAEKVTALLEIISDSDEGRTAITNSNCGILTLVETVEDGSLASTEHAVGALLSLCQSDRDKYRELILNEGAIPGLLRLTAEGTSEAQERARTLLDLLRATPEKKLASSVLEKIVYDIAARVDGTDKAAETAKRLLEDMLQRRMELSTDRIQRKSTSCTTSEISSS